MPKKGSPSPDKPLRADETPAASQRDVASTALALALQQMRTDVVDVVSKLAADRALSTHRDELRGALERDVAAATERVRRHLGELVDAQGDELRKRLLTLDELLRDLGQRLVEGSRRLDDVDRRVTPAHVEGLVEKAARDTAETVYEQRFQEGVDALTEAFADADDRFRQIRAYIDQFGPGGLPVVAQERDALRARVEELSGALDGSRRDILALKEALSARDAAEYRRRAVEGIDPETLDRRLADLAARERDLDVRDALEADKQRLGTEVERLRAALQRWEETGRAEQAARADAAQLQRYRDEAAQADNARLLAERQKSDAQTRMRQAQQEAERLAAELRGVQQDQASAQERQRRLDAVSEENRAFGRQFEEVRRTQSELERRLRDAQVERDGLVAEILALRREVEDATTAGRRAEAEARAEQVAHTRAELDKWAEGEAKVRAEAHRARAEALATTVERLQGLLAARDVEIARLTEELQRLKVALQGAQIELAGLREAHDKRVALLEAEVRASEARVLQTARDEAERMRREAAEAAERARAEAETYAAARRGEAERESERLLGMADQAESARNDLLAEIQERSAEKGQLDAEIERLKADLWDLKHRVVPAEERTRSLEECVFAADTLAPVSFPEEETWLAGLERGIAEAGFIFHPRLVRAFHTSLKIARHAPLVVLAGISGTGKSELPRLYADLGGVPFLPLAVQPSWASPHDLFGFFNYTDGRLKAEPVARLLHQVGKADDPLHESPSLVLLDEMNLARVEYYFADLLSKLEARRSVRGSTDPARRKRASVLVDTGPEGGELPVYLDERVLFVGTMNQDESTLTLSDKVLDRACVLTFPAPRTMHLTTQKETPRRAERLAWEAWTSWIREPAPGGENEEKLNAINRLMADLGRPFGHRLFRAIHAYVENYPGLKDHAFSDQFAMKIIPRLGGLECQTRKGNDGLKALGSLVPQELQDAFHTAADHEFFTWGGAPDLYQAERA